jgi:glutathione S-transferase
MVLQFYESLLGDSPYFAGEELTLADVVAGTLVPSLPLFGIHLEPYPKVKAWSESQEEFVSAARG